MNKKKATVSILIWDKEDIQTRDITKEKYISNDNSQSNWKM